MRSDTWQCSTVSSSLHLTLKFGTNRRVSNAKLTNIAVSRRKATLFNEASEWFHVKTTKVNLQFAIDGWKRIISVNLNTVLDIWNNSETKTCIKQRPYGVGPDGYRLQKRWISLSMTMETAMHKKITNDLDNQCKTCSTTAIEARKLGHHRKSVPPVYASFWPDLTHQMAF